MELTEHPYNMYSNITILSDHQNNVRKFEFGPVRTDFTVNLPELKKTQSIMVQL